MSSEVFWTVLFGLSATAIGLVTIWQNFQIVEIRRESESNPVADCYLLSHLRNQVFGWLAGLGFGESGLTSGFCFTVFRARYWPRKWYGQS
jgi:hypothetical protein